MSRTKFYKTPRQFVTLRLSKREWRHFANMAKRYKITKTDLATAIIGRSIAINMADHLEK